MVQIFILVFVSWVLLSARQNFFMDITTALVFSHYLFYFINDRIKSIDGWVMNRYLKLVGEEFRREEEF